MQDRISECNQIDLLPMTQNNPKENPLHQLYRHIRNIHRHIAATSIEALDEKVVKLFKKKKELRRRKSCTGNNADEVYYPVQLL